MQLAVEQYSHAGLCRDITNHLPPPPLPSLSLLPSPHLHLLLPVLDAATRSLALVQEPGLWLLSAHDVEEVVYALGHLQGYVVHLTYAEGLRDHLRQDWGGGWRCEEWINRIQKREIEKYIYIHDMQTLHVWYKHTSIHTRPPTICWYDLGEKECRWSVRLAVIYTHGPR